MRLVETYNTTNNWEYRQGPWTLEIIDETGKSTHRVSFSEGEPEDMTFGRDLSDVFSISNLVRAAYEAGRNGEVLHYEYVEEKE